MDDEDNENIFEDILSQKQDNGKRKQIGSTHSQASKNLKKQAKDDYAADEPDFIPNA